MLSCGPCEWLAVQGAGYRGACSRAGAGRRVSLACWARAGRRGAAETDLHFQSRGLFIILFPFFFPAPRSVIILEKVVE